MLLNLPLDILNDIALYLSSSEKLQLILTSKRLKDTIFDQCFYETVNIHYSNKKKTESVVLKFRKSKSLGEKVRFLVIDLQYLSNQLLSQIPLIFPNVARFYDLSYNTITRPEDAFSEFINWKDTLTYVKHTYGLNIIRDFIYDLLEKNVFSHLTTLILSAIIEHDESQISLLDCIRNAPALKHLTLDRITVNLDDVENIHSNCPLLVTFNMTSCVIIVTEDKPLCEEIMPTLRLSRFTLDGTRICDQQCLFLKYLTRKYINLTKLELNFAFSEIDLEAFFLERDIGQTEPDLIDRLDEARLTRESYISLASKILSNLPSTLKVLKITSLNLHIPNALFSKKCINITRLDFLADTGVCDTFFTSPQDIKVFQNLHLLKHLSMMVDPSLQKYTKGPASSSVTHFEVIIKGSSELNDMDIGWILSMFPSLHSLKIKYSGTRLIGYENDPPSTYPNLVQLFIGLSATHSNLLPFIRDAAPNLQDLHWKIGGKYGKENFEENHPNGDIVLRPNQPEMKNNIAYYRIDLSGFALNCFHLSIDLRKDYRDGNEAIFFKIKKKDEIRRQFLISEGIHGVHLVNFVKEDLTANVKTKVIVYYDYAKMIDIDSSVLIDLEKSLIQLKY